MKKTSLRPIVCATDFSPNAGQACRAGAAIARRCGKPLILLHVANQYNAYGATELTRQLRPLRKRLKTEAENLTATGVAVTVEILQGQLAEAAIPAFATEQKAELVIVSAVSKTAFDRWTLGSVSECVAETGAAPTLIVRNCEPFEAWARGERTIKVLVGTDFSATAEAPLRWLGHLSKYGPCDVTACYVDWPPEEQRRLGVHGRMSFPENVPEVQQILERDLREKVADALGGETFAIRVEASWGRPDVSLVDLARSMAADLVVIGTHQYRGFDRFRLASVSRGILRHAPMNVACVPALPRTSVNSTIKRCRHVLVAVGPGEGGGIVLPYAYSVVEDGGSVVLVQVQRSSGIVSRFRKNPRAKDSPRHSIEDVTGELRSSIPFDAEKRGITTEIEILNGRDASHGICQAAERANADVVCIGDRWSPGNASGSVSRRVLEQCGRPVLLIRPPLK